MVSWFLFICLFYFCRRENYRKGIVKEGHIDQQTNFVFHFLALFTLRIAGLVHWIATFAVQITWFFSHTHNLRRLPAPLTFFLTPISCTHRQNMRSFFHRRLTAASLPRSSFALSHGFSFALNSLRSLTIDSASSKLPSTAILPLKESARPLQSQNLISS